MKRKYPLFMLLLLLLSGCGTVYEISEATKQQAQQVEINLDEQTLDEINQIITNEN